MFRRARLVLLAVVILVLGSGAATVLAAPAPSGVNVAMQQGYAGDDGDVVVVGQIVNNTKTSVTMVKIKVDFYDATGKTLIGSESTYTSLDVLDPGDQSPFRVHKLLPGAKKYLAHVEYVTTTRHANHAFKVEVTDTSIDTAGLKHFIGTVTNTNTTAARAVRVDGTFFATDGHMVDTVFAFAASNETHTLQPGESAPFELIDNGYEYATEAFVGSSPDAPSSPITITVSPAVPVYGSAVTLTGRAPAGTAVTIQRYDVIAGWLTVATATADANGSYHATARILTTWFLRAQTDAGTSVPQIVTQKALATLTSNLSTVRKGSAVTLSGTVRPDYPGQKVAIQQAVGSTWKTIAYATLTSSSAYSYRWVPKVAGSFSLRLSVVAQSDSVANVSATRRIVVR